MPIQWYPGHMERARKQIAAALSKTDVVIEVCDARAPGSSRNPLLRELVADKPLISALNRCDQADNERLKHWLQQKPEEFTEPPLPISCKTGKGVAELRKKIQHKCQSFKWFGLRDARALVVGIPNVGKSALINTLAGHRKAAVANKPGHTRGIQMISAGKGLMVWDSPGILWPKFDDPQVGVRLALLGSIRSEILDPLELLRQYQEGLLQWHGAAIVTRYKLPALAQNLNEILHEIAHRRVPLLPGGEADWNAAGYLLLKEFQEGLLGPVFLD